MEASIADLKQRARSTWAAGNFDSIAQMFPAAGQRLAERAQIEPGMRVLDVACGTGAVTIPAALAGGACTGLDITPELLAVAQQHATEAGVDIEFVEGDAEELPFEDASFDRVVSQYGVMFAPRHEVAAAELARVCRPGGQILVASWTPDGMVGDMFKLMAPNMPPPPSFAKPPLLWGVEDHVRSLLEPHGVELTFEKAMAVFRGPSVEHIVAKMESDFGPWVMAQALMGERWAELRAQLYDLYASASDESTAGGVEAFGEYLVATGRKTG